MTYYLPAVTEKPREYPTIDAGKPATRFLDPSKGLDATQNSDSATGLKKPFVYGQTEIKGKRPIPPKGQKPCALPGCDVEFDLRSINSDERFCSRPHKDEYWRMAAKIGDQILRGGISVSGKSQKACVLELLQSFEGKWVDRPLQRLPWVNWNCISKLRKKGYEIESRHIYRDAFGQQVELFGRPHGSLGLRREYQYRLISSPVPKVSAPAEVPMLDGIPLVRKT
jgi:hypothetical protein